MIETILLYPLPGLTIGISGLVYMHWFDKPDEIEVIKEVVRTEVVYRDGKEPAKIIYVDNSPYNVARNQQALLRQQSSFNQLGLGAAQQDPRGIFGMRSGLL